MPTSIVLGSHLYFAREGETIDTIIVGPETTGPEPGNYGKPDADPASNWTSLGILGDVSIDHQKTMVDIMAPSPGALRMVDKLCTMRRLVIDFTLEQMSPMTIELLFGSGKIAGQFTPLAKRGPLKGWLKFQLYDQADQIVTAVDMWSVIEVEGAVSVPKEASAVQSLTIRAEMLHSTLNSANLSNLS